MKLRIFFASFLLLNLYHPTRQIHHTKRVCSPYIPLPVNHFPDFQECRREVKAIRRFKDPDAQKRTVQVVSEHGYDVETHTITTKDGYILKLFRVPGGKSSGGWRKPAVLLYHPFASVSDVWLILPSNKNLVFKLVNAGYDVWLANSRGTDQSQGHINLDKDRDIEYWDFSFHEMGIYDLPAMVELILMRTGNEKIFYIGHSQGGAIYLVGTSLIPELNDKIHASFLMAPAAYVGGAYHPLITKLLVPIVYTPIESLMYNIFRGRMEYRTPRNFLSYLGLRPVDICSVQALQCEVCDGAYYIFFDFNPYQANFTNTPNILRGLNTATLKSAAHMGQNVIACQFRKYDYGRTENLRRYGTTEPPSYPLENVRAPLHIFYGEQDPFITPPDIYRLAGDIRPEVLRGIHRVEDDTFTHNDFLTGKDADVLVYDRLIDMMSEYG